MGRLSKPALLNILTLFLGVLLSSTFFQSTAVASPIAGTTSLETRDLFKRYSGKPSGKIGDGGPDTSDYPSDEDIAAAYTAPSGPFVFFSGIQDSQAPYQYAQSTNNGAVILRGAFPKGYITRGKPQRSQQWWQDYLDRVSGFYADQAVKAGGRAYFVGKFDATVSDCSIWSRIELPTLIDGGIPITLVDYSNFANMKDYPVPPPEFPGFPPTVFRREETQALEKRAAQDYCFDWQGDREDPADPDSDPQVGLPYYPGNCGVHLQQYQKNEGQAASNGNGGTSDYRFTIQLKDDQQEIVGGVDYYDAPGGQGVDVTSSLPLVFIATAGNVDDDPVSFAYGGQSWKSSDAQCSVGGYDSGSRQMDCGFSC